MAVHKGEGVEPSHDPDGGFVGLVSFETELLPLC